MFRKINYTKLASFIIVLAALGAIAAGMIFFAGTKSENQDNEKIEAEVIENNVGEKKSLAGVLENKTAEEAIEDDAGRLEVNADDSEGAGGKLSNQDQDPEASTD